MSELLRIEGELVLLDGSHEAIPATHWRVALSKRLLSSRLPRIEREQSAFGRIAISGTVNGGGADIFIGVFAGRHVGKPRKDRDIRTAILLIIGDPSWVG